LALVGKGSTMAGSVIGLALLVIIVPICGALSDRLGRRKIFPIVDAIGMIVLFYPLLMLLNQPGFGVYVLVSASGWVVLGIWQSVYPTIQAELFPASVRVSGIGFAHQIVIAVFGGTAPLIAAAFVGAGHPMYVAIYMTVIVALCLVVYITLRRPATAVTVPPWRLMTPRYSKASTSSRALRRQPAWRSVPRRHPSP
jgi:MFS family permease